MTTRTFVLAQALPLTLVLAAAAQEAFTPISLAPIANDAIAGRSPLLPTGNPVHAGVPFSIPVSGSNCWWAGIPSGTGTRTATIPVGLAGVKRVHALLSTAWGQAGPASLVSVEFTAADGTTLGVPLVGGVEIRDWSNGTYTNTLTSPMSTNVFASGTVRRDMCTFILPAPFETQALTSIRLVDTGATGVQRLYVDGVTVVTDSPPIVSWPLAAGGNAHRYQAVQTPAGITWPEADAAARAAGGRLVTIASAAENAFVFSLISTSDAFWVIDPAGNGEGPWMGGLQPAGSPEPGGGWTWATGEPFAYTNWSSGEPNNNAGFEDRLIFFAAGTLIGPRWNDIPSSFLARGYVVEHSCTVDINGDGDLNADDLGDYITCYFGTPPCAAVDFNADGDVNADDLGDFITAYFTGCG